MKIISKQENKDYYDSLLALGQDRAVVYKREPYELNLRNSGVSHMGTEWGKNGVLKDLPKPLYELGKLLGVYTPHSMRLGETELTLTLTLVGFCGKLYLLTQVKAGYNYYLNTSASLTSRCRGYYDVDVLAENFPEFREPSAERLTKLSTLTPPTYYFERRARQIGQHRILVPRVEYERLALLENTDYDSLFRDVIQAPSFSLNAEAFVTNPVLKDLEFYRAVDAPQAFQRMEQYLSNQFLSTYPLALPLTEKQQVTRYDFDPTHAFRTRPGTRKPKRST
jgi:hypothetical protein